MLIKLLKRKDQLENLHLKSNKVLRELCKKLKINYRDSLKKSTYLLFFVVLLVVIFLINKTIQSPKENSNDVTIGYDNSIVIGSDNSKVEIIIYSSLTCPHCAKFHNDVLPKIKKEFVETGDAKIILENSGDGNYSGIDFVRENIFSQLHFIFWKHICSTTSVPNMIT